MFANYFSLNIVNSPMGEFCPRCCANLVVLFQSAMLCYLSINEYTNNDNASS